MKNLALVAMLSLSCCFFSCGDEKELTHPVFTMGEYSMFGVARVDECVKSKVYSTTFYLNYDKERNVYLFGQDESALETTTNSDSLTFKKEDGGEYSYENATYNWACSFTITIKKSEQISETPRIEAHHVTTCSQEMPPYECFTIINWVGSLMAQ